VTAFATDTGAIHRCSPKASRWPDASVWVPQEFSRWRLLGQFFRGGLIVRFQVRPTLHQAAKESL
jgi:hypothetical protein